ncbi:acid phosphatase det1, partial [Chytridiales sp. JEL 0842]
MSGEQMLELGPQHQRRFWSSSDSSTVQPSVDVEQTPNPRKRPRSPSTAGHGDDNGLHQTDTDQDSYSWRDGRRQQSINSRGGGFLKWLRERESQQGLRPNAHYYTNRQAYQHVVPDKTLYGVELPFVVLKKFSPDGQYLICFSKHYHSLTVYHYNGAQAYGNLHAAYVADQESMETEEDDNPSSAQSENAFDTFFTLNYEMPITSGTEILCKDFCLFTTDQRYLILASAVPAEDPLSAQEARLNPGSLDCFKSLDNVTFWVIKVSTGEICDSVTFKNDYIVLANLSGVQLHGDILAITSVQNQCIHFFHVKQSGTLVKERTIGWHNFADDEMLIAQYRKAEEKAMEEMKTSAGDSTTAKAHGPLSPILSDLSQEPYQPQNPTPTSTDAPEPTDSQNEEPTTHPFSGIKQRLMSFLFRQAFLEGTISSMRRFYLSFDQYQSLVLWRMQFMGDTHILIKFGILEQNFGRVFEPTATQPYIFVLYNLETSLVEAVYNSSSEELLRGYETWQELRNSAYEDMISFMTHPANNMYARDYGQTCVDVIQKAKNGGRANGVRRLLYSLPFNPQCFTESPYLDHNLFMYDEKVVNYLDRPRPGSDFPIKFWHRQTNLPLIRLDTNPLPSDGSFGSFLKGVKRFTHVIFHPTDPFIMTVLLHAQRPSTVNFHVKN